MSNTEHREAAAVLDYETAIARSRPSSIYHPRLFIDGDQWCAVHGENLQDGVCGFGESPAKAYADFDEAWYRPVRAGR